MNNRGIDPARSRIVLLGSATYVDAQLADVPQIAANLRDLRTVLTDPGLGGFPPECCIIIPPRASSLAIGRTLRRAALEAEDLLLFYFVGHGVPHGRSHELYLALHDTDVEAVDYSALRFDTVRGTFLDSGARNRVVIIDSCFSGRAIGNTLSGDQLGILDIEGTYTLASAPSNRASLVLPGEVHTAFTGRLLDLLREGTPDAGRLITLRDIYLHLRARLASKQLPLPQQRGTANADQLGLVLNRATVRAMSEKAKDAASKEIRTVQPERGSGPWDIAEIASPEEGRVNLAGLFVPGVEGMELRVEVVGDAIVAATVVLNGGALQLQAFAASEQEGIWGEVRAEIASGITQQGGAIEEIEGPLGWELRAQVPMQHSEGQSGFQVMRFVGADGPRWFLRGVISGQGAARPHISSSLEKIFRDTVVVRGEDPMSPRDPITLNLPDDAQMAPDSSS